jgi:hypothetical protein
VAAQLQERDVDRGVMPGNRFAGIVLRLGRDAPRAAAASGGSSAVC